MLVRFGGENGLDVKVGNLVLEFSFFFCEILCLFCNVLQNLMNSVFVLVVYRFLVLVQLGFKFVNICIKIQFVFYLVKYLMRKKGVIIVVQKIGEVKDRGKDYFGFMVLKF